MKKRLLASLLLLVMIFSLFPTTVFAATSPPDSEWINQKIEELQNSGGYTPDKWYQIAGSDVYWLGLTRWISSAAGLVTDTVLFIAPGEGAVDCVIPDYTSMPALWSRSNASQLYIAAGITDIGNHAFDGMTTLKKIEIEDTSALTRVGEYAFRGCDKLDYSEENPLNLSGVKELGKYAFSGCERLKWVTLGEGLTVIPQYAFSACGLSKITIPNTVEAIEEGAFASNSFSAQGHMVLPEGLRIIGERAFGRSHTVVASGGFTSLTIPSTVTEIGEKAFYGHQKLAEVTVRATKEGGLQKPGAAAFGTSPFDGAYSTVTDITDPISQMTYTNVNIGTKFYTEDEATAGLFVNNDNCFLGNLTPLKHVGTERATCTEIGWNIYEMTLSNVTSDDKPVVVQTRVEIPAVGHNYKAAPDRAATCTHPGYTVEVCTNAEDGRVPEDSCEAPERLTEKENDPADGHDYVVKENGVINPGISKSNDGDTVITYTCANFSEKAEENTHDGEGAPSYSWTIAKTTLTASTSHRLMDLTLPVATGVGTARLEWGENVNTTEPLAAKTHYPQVKLVIPGASGLLPEYTSEAFTIEVQVDKVKLDFSKVKFQNNIRFTGQNNPDFAVADMPEGTVFVSEEYCREGEDLWTADKPAELTAENAAEYKVRVTYSYDNSKYQVDLQDPALMPALGYDVKAVDDSTVTITGDYIVRGLTEKDLTADAIESRTYDGTAQTTVRVGGIPNGTKVTVSWREGGEKKTEVTESADTSAFEVAKITAAGDYTVTVVFEGETISGKRVEKSVPVTVRKKTIETPTANPDIQAYDPTREQVGVQDSGDTTVYEVFNNRQTEAGRHVAEAKLKDPANYRWSTGDEDQNGTVEISYFIPRRQLSKPDILSGVKTSAYNGGTKRALTTPNSELTYTYDDSGTMSAWWNGTQELVYTATNAQKTDVGDYDVRVELADTKNYVWSDLSDQGYGLSWKITPRQIYAPTVTAGDAVYTGTAYDAAGHIKLTAHSENSADLLTLGTDHRYYTSQTGPTPLSDVPVDVGSYWVEVDLDFLNNEKESNYQIIRSAESRRIEFQITPATASLAFDQEAVTANYTVAGTPLQAAAVNGLMEPDQGKPGAYSVTYQYRYQAPDAEALPQEWTDIENPEDFTFKDTGHYEVKAALQSANYTASAVSYTLDITSSQQTVVLESEDTAFQDNSITKTLGEAPFTVTGKGQVAGADTNAKITYVSLDEEAASVDQNGQVSLHMATAEREPVTITVTAAGGSNYGEAVAEYTVTINKGTPVIVLDQPEITAQYTGQPLRDYEKAASLSGAGNEAVDPSGDPSYAFYTDEKCGEASKVTDGGGEGGNVPVAAGIYYMQVTYAGDSNYSAAEAKVVKVTIETGGLTVAADGYSDVYDGQDHDAITVTKVTGAAGEITGGYTVHYAVTNTDAAPDANSGDWTTECKVKDVADSTDGDTFYWYKVTADNHAPEIQRVTVTITPAPVTLTGIPDHFTKPYDSSETVTTDLSGIAVTAEGVSGEMLQKTSATGAFADKNAGENKDVSLTLALSGTQDWGNYAYEGTPLTGGEITLTRDKSGTITPREIAVTGGITVTDRVYDGSTKVVLGGTPTTDGKIGSDTLTLSLADNAFGTLDSADVGEGKPVAIAPGDIVLGGADQDNYLVTAVQVNAAVNISPRPVTLVFEGAVDGIITKPFNGKPVPVKVKAEDAGQDTGFVPPDSLREGDVQYTYNDGANAPDAVGQYTVTAALKDQTEGDYSNYQLTFPAAAALNITPAGDLTVTAEDYTAKYTGDTHDVTAGWQFAGYASDTGREVLFMRKTEGQTQNPEGDGNWAKGNFKNVSQSGEYWYCVTAPNHDLVYGENPVEIIIQPLALTVTPTLDGTKEYDGTPNFDTDKIAKTEVTGTAGEEVVTAAATSGVYEDAARGENKEITITYTLTGADLSNYTYGGEAVPQDGLVTATVQDGAITPKKITATIVRKTKVYDGSAPTVGSVKGTDWTVDENQLCDMDRDGQKDDLLVSLAVKDPAKNVGNYDIVGKSDNRNYEVTFAGETFAVTPRPITLAIGDAAGFYGDEPDKSKVVLTDVSDTVQDPDSGLVSGEELSQFLAKMTIGANGASPVEVYPISGNEGPLGNYKVTFQNEGHYTVNRRPITVRLKDASSNYGCEIADLSSSWTADLTPDTYTGPGTDAIVNGDVLEITVVTDAERGDGVGPYSITGAAAAADVAGNYAITWETATYTIERAELKIAYRTGAYNVAMGGQVDNPLKFTNVDSKQELPVKPADVTVEYMSGDKTVATVDKESGMVTVEGVGTATITATITNYGDNYEQRASAASVSYTLTVVQGGAGIQVSVQPNTLTYTGEALELVTTQVISPAGVEVRYRLDASEPYTESIPTGVKADIYVVEWVASASGYNPVSGTTHVEIHKADPSDGFRVKDVQTDYAEDKVFDATEHTTLHIHEKYWDEPGARIEYESNNTQVAEILDNDLSQIRLNGQGDAKISAVFSGTENFNPKTVSFTLDVAQAGTVIEFLADNYEIPYDGNSHGSDIQVTYPTNYTIMYSENEGAGYKLDKSPVVTDVKDSPLEIYFQVQAEGYQPKNGTQIVTITPRSITECVVSGVAASYTYTGQKIITPTVEVHDGNTRLVEGTDYEVTYGENTQIGSSVDEDLSKGGGWVKITGKGNYEDSVTKYFTITAIESSYLSAALDRYFGYYGDNATNNAAVTVRHGEQTVSEHEIALSVSYTDGDTTVDNAITAGLVEQDGLTLTFKEAGNYTISVEVHGTYQSGDPFTLSYTLLPQDAVSDSFIVTGPDQDFVTYDGKDHAFPVRVTDKASQSLTEGKDYTLTYRYLPFVGAAEEGPYHYGTTAMTEAGLYIVTVTGADNYSGSATLSFLVQQRNLSDSGVEAQLDADGLTYNGREQEPAVTLRLGDREIQELVPTLYYSNINAGEGQAVSTASGGSNNFTGTRVDAFAIKPKDINHGTITVGKIPDQPYSGRPVTPIVAITDSDRGGAGLVLGADYTVTANNDGAPSKTASASIAGTGNYTGIRNVTFVIESEGERPPEKKFTLTVTPDTAWTYGSAPDGLALSVQFGDDTLVLGTDYTLTVNHVTYDGADGKTLADAVAAIQALKPGRHTVTAQGEGKYSSSRSQAEINVSKAELPLTIDVTPSSKAGGGEAEIQVTIPDTWPAGIDGTKLTAVTVEKGSVDQSSLKLEYAPETGAYKKVRFSFPNESATYTFGVNTDEIVGFASDCYELAVTGGRLQVLEQTSGGGGGGGGDASAYVIEADAGRGGSISPNGKVSVVRGEDMTFRITPHDGYEITDVQVDGKSVGAVGEYTFKNVRKDHTISASFRSDIPVVDPGQTGVADWLNTKDHIAYLGGYGGGLFGPDDNMTRAQAAQMFYNLLLNKDVPVTVSFTDVAADTWYAKAVNTLGSLGIVQGIGDGKFAPEYPVTRAEFTVMAMRFAHLDTGGENIFSDVKPEDWFYEQVVGSVKYGWIGGYSDGTFRPNITVTRAEVTTIVNRMLGRGADAAYVDGHTDALKQFSDLASVHWAYYEIMEAANRHDYSKKNGEETWTRLR